tara:strand:+ start:13 stop:423 length:411 start_codon:yes stop_codon:yes gene_type:complete
MGFFSWLFGRSDSVVPRGKTPDRFLYENLVELDRLFDSVYSYVQGVGAGTPVEGLTSAKNRIDNIRAVLVALEPIFQEQGSGLGGYVEKLVEIRKDLDVIINPSFWNRVLRKDQGTYTRLNELKKKVLHLYSSLPK